MRETASLLQGWIHAIRKLGAVNFLILRDRTGMAQVILEPEQLEKLEGLQVETVVAVEGSSRRSLEPPVGSRFASSARGDQSGHRGPAV